MITGVSIWLTRGRTLSGFPDALIHVSNETIAGIPISFGVFVVVALGVHILLTRTVLGIRIHMIGSNLEFDALLRRRYAAGSDLGLCAVEPALLAGGDRDDGAI